MSRFLSRLLTSHREEALLISIRVFELELQTSCKIEGIYVEWIRGDTTEHSGKLGFVNTIRNTLNCNHKFEKLSIFYNNPVNGQSSYLEKWSTLRVMATSGDAPSKYPLLMGECTFDLSTYIGKKEKVFKFQLTNASQLRGELKAEIVIKPEHVVKQDQNFSENPQRQRTMSMNQSGVSADKISSIMSQMEKVMVSKTSVSV